MHHADNKYVEGSALDSWESFKTKPNSSEAKSSAYLWLYDELKFRYFEKAEKIERKSPTLFWSYALGD